MQEEVENRTINLAISTTKLTGRSIVAGIRKYLQHREKAKVHKDTQPHGKQTVKQLLGCHNVNRLCGLLLGQNQGATNTEIDKSEIRDFERLAKKYGVDYAVRKDKSANPPRYLVFVKARDGDVLDSIVKEHLAKQMTQEKRPSILKQLSKLKAVVASIPKKIQEKKQERDL